ncbi:MAG: hypothetical protein PHS17_15125, partial [Desulfobacterales bacterium]|nr:hypothetical protein [Desulfobacterales bacterium]
SDSDAPQNLLIRGIPLLCKLSIHKFLTPFEMKFQQCVPETRRWFTMEKIMFSLKVVWGKRRIDSP